MQLEIITIAGHDYAICLSNNVLAKMEKQGIRFEDLAKDDNPHRFTDVLTVLSSMIDAGARFARKTGQGEYASMSAEDLGDLTGPDDYGMLMGALVRGMGKVQVQAEAPKNGGTLAQEDRAG